MPLSRNLNSYADVQAVLNTAQAQGGVITYRLESHGAAVHWRARAYQFRRLLIDEARRLDSRKEPTTGYDNMILRVVDDTVRISFGIPRGELLDADGNAIPVDIHQAENEAEDIIRRGGVDLDDFEVEAAALRKRLGIPDA